MTRRVSMILAGALVSLLSLGSIALALTTPTLSMTATSPDSKIRATGTFNPVVTADCGSKKNRTVTLQGVPGSVTGSTNNSGGYNFLTGHLATGAYTVHTVVNGDMTGPYGANLVCNDAVSGSVTVSI